MPRSFAAIALGSAILVGSLVGGCDAPLPEDLDAEQSSALPAGDCRADLAGTCSIGSLCNRESGRCERVRELDCRRVRGLCWENQRCSERYGYCVEDSIDASLDYDVQVYDLALDANTVAK